MDHIDFSEFFATKAEANDFLSGLTAVIDKIFQTDFHIEAALSEKFGINKSDRLLAIMRENNINTQSRESVKMFLNKMQEEISKLPVMSLTIAFEPQEKTLKTLSEWFLINTKKQVLFDFSVDRKVVAGATLNYNGKFFDFSIRPVFERILKAYTSRLIKSSAQPQQQSTTVQPVHQRVQDISIGR
jgi:F0F1-type ATP synthase delta subunit